MNVKLPTTVTEMLAAMAEDHCTDGDRGLRVGDSDQCGQCGGSFIVTATSHDGVCRYCAQWL